MDDTTTRFPAEDDARPAPAADAPPRPPVSRYAPRAEEYRAKAAAEAALGAASPLEQVRAKHERAAKVWTELAEHEAVIETRRAARFANAGAGRSDP